MIQDIDLRALAELGGSERAFLSFYASGVEGLRSLDNRAERVRRLLRDEPAELEHFDASLALLRRWLDEQSVTDGHVAVFTCAALDLAQGWPLPVEVPTLLRAGSSPYLRPLAELRDDYGTLAIVAADNRATQIHVVTADGAAIEGAVRGDVKNAVKKGGWSQKRYARRREKQLERYADEVVEVLIGLDHEHEFDCVVMVGSDESLQEIDEQLPASLRDRVTRHDGFDPSSGTDALVEAGWQEWFSSEREEEARTWERIRDEALGHGLAVLGPTDVLAAVTAGRCAKILVDRDAKVKGTRCRACGHLVHGTPETCQACGSADVFALDLVNEIVRLAELSSAPVEFCDPSPSLAEEGGTGALLRY